MNKPDVILSRKRRIWFLISGVCILLWPAVIRANDEPVRLPERVILGEDKAAKTIFTFTGESASDTSLPASTLTLPSLSFSTISVSAGSWENLGASFSRQSEKWFLDAGFSQRGIEPFPEAVKEISLGAGRKKMTRLALLCLSLSGGTARDLPAVRRSGGRFLADSLSESGFARITLSSTFLPANPVNPHLSVTHTMLTTRREADTEVIWPRWSGQASINARFTPKAALSLFLDYESDYDNSAVETRESLLPGIAFSYRFPRDLVTVSVKNFTNRGYEILPGLFGPGLTAVINYSHSF